MMSNPVIADNNPMQVNVKKGEEYYFCACGRSNNQPFCDGSHEGTGIEPKAFTAGQDGELSICMCKHSSSFPFCDGTHQQFSNEKIGSEGPG